MSNICPSCLAGPGQGHDPDCNADRRPRVNGILVCKCDYSAMLSAELTKLRTELADANRRATLWERNFEGRTAQLAAAQALAPGGELEAHLEEAARLLRVCCADPDIMAGWPSLKTWKAADAALRANAGR